MKSFLKVASLLLFMSLGTQANEVASAVVLTQDNTITMNDYFYGESVSVLTQKAKDLDAKLASDEPIYLVLNSGGGSIDAGIELIQNLNTLNRPVKTITLFAASMGFQTVQGLKGNRLITKDGTLMSHKASGGFYGEFPGQLDSRYSYYLKRIARLDEQVVIRSGGKHDIKSYNALIENEYWCDGQDCIIQGFADSIINPSCDQSLKGTSKKLYHRFLYMGHIVEIVDTISNCPLITSALSYNIYIDGQPLFTESIDTGASPVGEVQYFGGYSSSLVGKLGIETIENIKKQIGSKLDSRRDNTTREVRKY